jgi:hypothetical protein
MDCESTHRRRFPWTNGLLVHGPMAENSRKQLKNNKKMVGPGGLNRAAQVSDQWIMSLGPSTRHNTEIYKNQ